MVVEYIRYRIPAERDEEFVAMYRQAQRHLQRAPQCLSYELTRCAEEPERYVLRIEWQSTEAHLEGFRKGPEFPGFLALVRPFVPLIEEMQHYERTDVAGRGAGG